MNEPLKSLESPEGLFTPELSDEPDAAAIQRDPESTMNFFVTARAILQYVYIVRFRDRGVENRFFLAADAVIARKIAQQFCNHFGGKLIWVKPFISDLTQPERNEYV